MMNNNKEPTETLKVLTSFVLACRLHDTNNMFWILEEVEDASHESIDRVTLSVTDFQILGLSFDVLAIKIAIRKAIAIVVSPYLIIFMLWIHIVRPSYNLDIALPEPVDFRIFLFGSDASLIL